MYFCRVNETGSSNDPDTHSPFEDAIEHSDDKIESIIPEELPPESVTLTTTVRARCDTLS